MANRLIRLPVGWCLGIRDSDEVVTGEMAKPSKLVLPLMTGMLASGPATSLSLFQVNFVIKVHGNEH
jgi:hypothetical protein